MALNVAVIDGMTSSTAGDLTSLLSSLLSQEGVVITDGTDLDVTQADTPALSVEVKAGTCFVTNDGFTKNNGEVKHWHVTVTDDEEVSVDSNSSGSTRIDAICVKVDTAVTPDSTASNVATLVAVKGTPGAGNPVIPDNHLLLAYISVEDSETQILDADITDSRQYFGVALPHTSGLRLQDTGGAVDAQLYEDTTGDIYLVGSKSGGGIRIRQASGTVEQRQDHTNDWEAVGSGSADWTEADETWTYSSVDDPTGVITVPSDATTKYSVGMRIRFVNGGNTIYGIITAVTSTTITFLHEIDPTDSLALNLLANSAITLPYFSTSKAPFGFPLETDKWSIEVVISTFSGVSSPSSGTVVNPGSIAIDIPIGSWNIELDYISVCNRGPAGVFRLKSGLSTANNSFSSDELAVYIEYSSANITWDWFSKQIKLNLTTKDTYYLVIMQTGIATATNLGFGVTDADSFIRAVCAYL